MSWKGISFFGGGKQSGTERWHGSFGAKQRACLQTRGTVEISLTPEKC